MNKLEKLLYRKKSIENLMSIWSSGIKTYEEYSAVCRLTMHEKSRTDFEKAEARKNLHEAEIPLRHYITSFKLAQREYDHHIVPEIEKEASEKEREGIAFKDMEKAAQKLAHIEIFGEHQKQPENVELVAVNESITEHIELLHTLIVCATEKSTVVEDEYERAKMKLAIFKYQLHEVTNRKRLSERLSYYNNQFKPKYDADMKEADKYLDKMIDRAKEIIKLDVDVKLGFLLNEYEKNKEDKEKVWLFYTALKSRLNKIGKEMRRHKGQFKGKMHLAEPIVK